MKTIIPDEVARKAEAEGVGAEQADISQDAHISSSKEEQSGSVDSKEKTIPISPRQITKGEIYFKYLAGLVTCLLSLFWLHFLAPESKEELYIVFALSATGILALISSFVDSNKISEARFVRNGVSYVVSGTATIILLATIAFYIFVYFDKIGKNPFSHSYIFALYYFC